ncbi:hypothetical protein ACLB6M_17320 [Enterobacter hormaechei]
MEVKSDSSPFVMIFHDLNSNVVASALNFVILVASLSVYNSGVYSNSRMLFGLFRTGATRRSSLPASSRHGVPINSLFLFGRYHLAGGADQLSAAERGVWPAGWRWLSPRCC